MKNIIFFVLATLLVIGCQQNKTKSSDSALKTYFESSSIPAAIMGTIDADGKTTWHHFGPSIWEDSTTVVSENNIFRIYSMTKAITSVAALQLSLIHISEPTRR